MSVSMMKKLTVFALQKDADALLSRLVKLRCVEVERSDLTEESQRRYKREAERVRADAAARLQPILTVLPELVKYSEENRGIGRSYRSYDPTKFNADGSRDRADRTVKRTLELISRQQEVNEELGRLQAGYDALEPWLNCDLSMEQRITSKTVTVMGCCPSSVKQAKIEEAMESIGALGEMISADRNGTYLTVTFLKSEETQTRMALSAIGFTEADLPLGDGTPQQIADRMETKRDALEAELQTLEDSMRDLAESLDVVEILHDLTDTDLTVATLRQRLVSTDACAVLEGWIPAFKQEAVEAVLSGYECAYECRDPVNGEDPPVLLRNNGFASNFEWVVGMYSYPKYGRFDPTAIMSIFYFLIFGLMFADVGYGLLLVIGGFGGAWLLGPRASLRRMLCMFGYCGISAMLMGVIFGGWFGDLPVAVMQNLLGVSVDSGVGHFFGSGLWFNPLDNPLEFLILALAVGGVHLIAGMAVRFYILCRDGKSGEALCTIVPYWVLFAGLLTLLFNQTIGAAISAVGGALIVILNGYGIRNPFKRLFKGLGGLYGLINYASDLLSYSRILALGLVASVIAKVINMITALGSSGVLGAIVMVIVLIVGHGLNLAINVLGSFVHTSRLQYMEFFGKFYEDGGRVFEPAVPTEKYSEAEEPQNL